MSAHEVLVVQIESVMKHPNADALEMIKVSGYDYSILSQLNQFRVGDLAIFIEPDYVVPTNRAEFSFLNTNGKKEKVRITVKRLRGIWSDGLLLQAQTHHKLGDNVIEEYGIVRYEPPPPRTQRWWNAEGADLQSGWTAFVPDIKAPKYDLENERKYSSIILPEEEVFYTVKIHGTNARFVYHNDQMFCGSHNTWRAKPGTSRTFENNKTGETVEKIAPGNTWWEVLNQHPWLEEWCKRYPDHVVYGEIFGPTVQGNLFHYGYKDNQLGFRVFDVLEKDRWVSFTRLIFDSKFSDLKMVPLLYHGNHNRDTLMELAERNEDRFECGDSHIREGIVIKLATERIDERIGRIVLKHVSRNYLQKS